MDTTNSPTLRDMRKAKGLTLVQVGAACGMSAGNLSRIERGDEGVTVKRIVRIAGALKESPESVLAAFLRVRASKPIKELRKTTVV